jgi:CheY-like chemotaxis protein
MHVSKSSPNIHSPPMEEPQDDEDASVISRRLHHFFSEQGLPRHKHASQLAVVLGLSRSGAFRKFQDSSFSVSDLKTLAQHFQIDVSLLLSPQSAETPLLSDGHLDPAQIFIGTTLLACKARVGAPLAPGEHCELVATAQDAGWLIQPYAMASHSSPRHRVVQLVMFPQQRKLARIAVLEDSHDLADNLKDAFEGAGYQVELFTSASDLAQRATASPFDAYVVDWWLNGQTAAAALQGIRRAQPNVPLILTTGAIATGHAVEDDIVRVATALRIQVIEKPFRLALLISQVKQKIEEAAERTH